MSVSGIGGSARELLNEGRPDEAIALLEKHCHESGESAETLNLLGEAHAMQGRFEKAVILNDRAIALAPDLADAHFDRALALFKLARYAEACAGFRRVIALDPHYPTADDEFQQADLFAHRADELVIRLGEGFSLCVPRTLQLMTPYILLEQGDWFEDEIHFVRKLLKTGDEVIDIGANYGVYAMSMAHVVGSSGKVWAFEPASRTARWLRKSVDLNAATRVTVIEKALSSEVGTAKLSLKINSELNSLDRTERATDRPTEIVALSTLDAEMDSLGMLDPVFVKLDAEGEELSILDGSGRFFERFDPLVMFELKHGNTVNTGLIEAFVQRGFDVYRLIPRLDVLVPARPQAGFDRYQLNLFACREERARQLNADGRLVYSRTPAAGKAMRAVSWREDLIILPYTMAFPAFSGTLSPLPGADENQKSLDAWCSADAAPTAEERVAWLDVAWRHACSAATIAPTPGRLITKARIARAIGLRTAAAEVLRSLVGERDFPVPEEPFLAPGAFCENEVIALDPGRWLSTRVLESLERLKSYSGYFLGKKALETYEALAKNEGMSPALRRRIDLAQARFGRGDYPF